MSVQFYGTEISGSRRTATQVYGLVFTLFEQLLRSLLTYAAEGHEWNIHNTLINKASIDGLLERIILQKSGKKYTFSGTKNDSSVLFEAVFGMPPEKRLPAECVAQVAFHLYVHALVFHTDVKGIEYRNDGILFVDGQYFPSSQQVIEYKNRKNIKDNTLATTEQTDPAVKAPKPIEYLTGPAQTITGNFGQIIHLKLPRHLLAKLVSKIGGKLQSANLITIKSHVEDIFAATIALFEELLQSLDKKFQPGHKETRCHVEISKTSIQSALGRIKDPKYGDNKFSGGMKDAQILFGIAVGGALTPRNAPDCIRQVALYLYAHALALLGGIQGVSYADNGLLYVDGKYFPSEAEMRECTRVQKLKDKNRKQAASDRKQADSELEVFAANHNGESNESNWDHDIAGMAERESQKWDAGVDEGKLGSDGTLAAAVGNQANLAPIPLRRFIQLLNIVSKKMNGFESIPTKKGLSDVFPTVIGRIQEILRSLVPIFEKGLVVNKHTVTVNKSSIKSGLERIKDHQKSNNEKSRVHNSGKLILYLVCGMESGGMNAADCVIQAALHIYAYASVLYGDIEGISYGEDGVLRMGENYFPTGAQIIAQAAPPGKKRKRSLTSSNESKGSARKKQKN